MTFKRWYDADVRLSAVVRTMECMNESSQRQFAEKLLELSQELLAQQGGEYLSTLDNAKQEGLKKSQAKKRWYDQYESLHRAFNNLYALDGFSRRNVADKLSTPIEIVQGYELHCEQTDKTPDVKVVEEVLRSCFKEGPERARRLYALYLPEFNEALQKHQQGRNKKAPAKGLWVTLLENLQSVLTG